MENNKGAAEMVDRKEGYYWVKETKHSDFEIARWWTKEGNWTMNYSEWERYDEDFSEIDERQICRS